MTTLDDGVRELLDDPTNRLLHCQVIDRLQDDAADVRAELLKLVIANRDNDGPRLCFAEWAERNGEKERAEFIRVQCELPHCWRCTPPKSRYCECRHCSLQRRERELFLSFGERWVSDPFIWKPVRPQMGWEFCRGFIGFVECTGADWLRRGNAICETHPIERVRLTTLPETVLVGETDSELDDRQEFWCLGELVPDELEQEVFGVWLPRGTDPESPTMLLALLQKRWPGITFELPLEAGAA